MNKDPYATLGISKDASADEIKSAYREKAKEYHPDRNKSDGADVKFKEINDAYEMINDPHKRASFDRGGSVGGGFGFGGFGGVNPFAQWQNNMNAPRKGEPVELTLYVDFVEIFHNSLKTVTYKRHEVCKICSGNGLKIGKNKTTCKVCGGSGNQTRTTRHNGGVFTEMRPCQPCGATGSATEDGDRCETCSGSGFQLNDHSINIEIHAGINNEILMTARNEGNAGINGGPPGDLYIRFQVSEHPLFKRSGSNIIRDFEISYVDSCLGKTEKIDLPDGSNIDVVIPPLSEHGSVIVVNNQGIPDIRTKIKGDLHVVVKTKMPKKLTEEYINILKQLSTLENQNA